MTKSVYVYGLFTKRSNRCLYVGCTGNPRSRESGHRLYRTTGNIPFKLRVLRRVSRRFGRKHEATALHYYLSLGQAKFNVNKLTDGHKQLLSDDEVIQRARDLKLGGSFVVGTISERNLAIRIGRYRFMFGKSKVNARSSKNKDGTYTIRAVKP